MQNQTLNAPAKPTASELWDEIAVYGDYQNKALRDYMNSQYSSLIIRWIGSVRNKSILKTDMYEEALNGKSVLYIFRQYNKIRGVDISKLVINKVAKNPALSFISGLKVGDIRDKIFRKAEFDIILSLSTLDHIPKKDFTKALDNINCGLKREGTLILSLNNSSNIMFYIIHKIDSLVRLKFPSYFYSMGETKKALSKTGFTVLNEDYTVFIPPLFRTFANMTEKSGSKMLNKVTAWLISKLEIKNCLFRKVFGYYLVVHAKKVK